MIKTNQSETESAQSYVYQRVWKGREETARISLPSQLKRKDHNFCGFGNSEYVTVAVPKQDF